MRGKERERKGEWEGGRERKEEGKRERGAKFYNVDSNFRSIKDLTSPSKYLLFSSSPL